MKEVEQLQDKIMCSFSCGATSTVATYLALKKYGCDNCDIVYFDTGSEHSDNERFLTDCEKLFNKEIIIVKSEKYKNLDESIEKSKMLNSPRGASCTTNLKLSVNRAFRKNKNYKKTIIGFHSKEVDRAMMYKTRYPQYNAEFPLVERDITHADCIAKLKDWGIELPMMYKLGYRNNNCIGCVKGGMGYWNKIRKDFPEVFNRRAKQERKIGHSCINGIFLDELPLERGIYSSENEIECDLLCRLL